MTTAEAVISARLLLTGLVRFCAVGLLLASACLIADRYPDLRKQTLLGKNGLAPQVRLADWTRTAAPLAAIGVLLLAAQRPLVRWFVPVPRRRCPRCNYTPDGLRDPRCPECGLDLPVDWTRGTST